MATAGPAKQPHVQVHPSSARGHSRRGARRAPARRDLERPPFRAAARDGLDGRVVAFHGELDIAGVKTALEAVVAADRAGGPVLIDLGDLTFIDATGLRVLIVAQRLLGDRLTLSEARGMPARLFELAGVASTLPFVVPALRSQEAPTRD